MTASKSEKAVVLVTGGASGIGRATVTRLVNDGYHVVIADYNRELLEETLEETEQISPFVSGEILDVRHDAAVEALFKRWPRDYGRLDVLVNNAATTSSEPITLDNLSTWDLILEVNLRGAFVCSLHAHPFLKQSRGAVINMASVMGLYVYPGNEAYCASKAGLIHLTKVLAKKWREDHIRVNAIAPAGVDTPLLRRMREESGRSSEEVEGEIEEGIRKRKIQRAEQIADVAAMLLQPDAAVLTGRCVVADDGSQL